MTFTVVPVPTLVTSEVWPDVLPLVESALEYADGERTADDLLEMVSTGHALLWLVLDGSELQACCITNISHWPRMKVATAIIIAGDGWDEWGSELVSTVKEWAKGQGCDRLEGWGRRGWGKKMTPHGFKQAYVVMRLEL